MTSENDLVAAVNHFHVPAIHAHVLMVASLTGSQLWYDNTCALPLALHSFHTKSAFERLMIISVLLSYHHLGVLQCERPLFMALFNILAKFPYYGTFGEAQLRLSVSNSRVSGRPSAMRSLHDFDFNF